MTRDLFSSAEPEHGKRLAGAVGRGARELGVTGEPASSGTGYSVSDVTRMGRELLENAFPPLWVSGEVGNWTRARSGHCYFSLRDSDAQLRCVMFRSDAKRLPTDPEEGTEVRALGTLTIYQKRGRFQLKVRELEAAGSGGLWRQAFERLRKKLDGEGLLADGRKRSVPRCPATVGVITSPVGAALHDVLDGIERRAPWVRVLFSPARVQGERAAEEVARAIELFGERGGADVLIVGRGGGSIEDLWAFNEERLARAIAESPVPVISAVGHEVDVTIADLVADARVPTPSAAAETAVPDGDGMARELRALGERLEAAARDSLAARRGELAVLRDALSDAARGAVRRRRERLARAAGKLEALSPLAALRRGYALPLDDGGRVLRGTEDFETDARFRLRVVDGDVGCRVEDVSPEETKDPDG